MKTRFKDSDKPILPYLHGNAAAMAGDEHPVFFLNRKGSTELREEQETEDALIVERRIT